MDDKILSEEEYNIKSNSNKSNSQNYGSVQDWKQDSSSSSTRPSLSRRSTGYDKLGDQLIEEHNGLREWYLDYSTIDWIHDYIKERIRSRELNKIPGIRGTLLRLYDSLQPWILVVAIGITSGIISWFIVVVSELLSDLKLENCFYFKSWAQLLHLDVYSDGELINFIFYLIFALVFATSSAYIVYINGYHITSKSKDIKVRYYAAGSGIPEIKTILSGFVMRGFLGLKTLLVKAFGLILSVASGMSLGKEGPMVHITCCIGNILCKIFDQFHLNESNRRQILSASSAAGVSVAFGAPIGGILFSLEEVSYYFPINTLWKSFLCAIVAAMTLKITNPFGTGKIVLFQVSFDKTWYTFEILLFCFIGLFGGIFGALFCKLNIYWCKLRKNSRWSKMPVKEVFIVALVTTLLNYANPFTRLSTSELVADLFAACKSPGDREDGLCVSQLDDFDSVIKLLGLAIIEKFLMTVITFGIKVPAGVFIPSMAIGACFGRMIGLLAQRFQQMYPTYVIFSVCGDIGTNCFTPGVYAMVGAASALAGVTRMTVSLVVIMFELTNSLSYGLPIMLAVMISKWTGDSLVPSSIYDSLIELNEYPFLDNKHTYDHGNSLSDIIIKDIPIIDINQINNVNQLHSILKAMTRLGYKDSGIPILNQTNLLGYINFSDLEHALDNYDTSKYSEIIKFRLDIEGETLIVNSDENPIIKFVDQAPMSISFNASIDIALEMFTKLGITYLCVLKGGKFVGLIHKKGLLSYLNQYH